MTENTDEQLMLTWLQLKKIGHPFSRTHTRRKEEDTIELTGAYGKERKVIPNPDPFPKAVKLGPFPNSPLVWSKKEVLAYYKRHGIHV